MAITPQTARMPLMPDNYTHTTSLDNLKHMLDGDRRIMALRHLA